MGSMTASAERLEQLQRRHQELARQVLNLGFVQKGTVVQRHTFCRTPGCRCHADPPQPHGPYWQWSSYESGRTVSRRLTEAEAQVYRQGTENRRRLQQIVAEMEAVGEEARQLLLQRAQPERPGKSN